MSTRIQTADVLKGLAILFMIQVHIVELFASETIYNSDPGKLALFFGGPVVAPVFMIIFGFFIALSDLTVRELIFRGLKIFFLGMLLNLALNFNLIISVINGKIDTDLWPYISGVDILQFAGISLIVIAVFKNLLKKETGFLLSAIVISVFSGQILPYFAPEIIGLKYLSAFIFGSTSWSYFPLFPWLAYPLSGMLFYKIRKEYDLSFLFTVRNKMIIGTAFLVFVIFTAHYAINITSDLPLYYHHGVIFFGWTIVFVSCYTLVVCLLDQWFGRTLVFKWLKWMGKNVTLIYVIQWIIIGNTATEIYKTISSPLYLIACFFGVLLLSNGIAYGTLKLKERFFTASL